MGCYLLHKKISAILFRGWCFLAPPLRKRFQHFDTRMFLKNEMCPDFEWKKYVKKKNPYWKKWGFDISGLDAAYYGKLSGIEADHYVTRSMAVHFIYPYLDRYDFVPAYMDKNVQKSILGLPDAELGVMAAEDVVYNANGVFYTGDGKECSRETALETLLSFGEALILKPSVETFGGRGVVKVERGTDRSEFDALMTKYRYDYTFQKMVVQHPVFAQFNPTSLNTIRIVTYRDPSKRRKVLYSCVRFGGEGSVMDNVCSGGGYTGVDIETGKLLNRKRYSYYVMDVPFLPDSMPDRIPCWEVLKKAALELHGRLPQLDIVGWDFALSPDGHPVFIEFNPRPGVGLQQAVGPMFNREDLDELMAHVSKVRAKYLPLGAVRFKDYPDRTTIHHKFFG